MMRSVLLIATLTATTTVACSKRLEPVRPEGDDCQKVADRSGVMFAKLPEDKRAAAKTSFLEKCREPDSRLKQDPMFVCLRDAADDQAAAACATKGFDGYVAKSKQTEAKLTLNRIGRSLRTAHDEAGVFPTGSAPLSPATPCCEGPDKKCPAGTYESWAAQSKAWADLEFAVQEPHYFQYSYQSDGVTATATAVGDLDCDGQAITFTLEAKADRGEVSTVIDGPVGTD